MKHLGIIVALLITIVSDTAGAQAQRQRSEPLRAEINETIKNLPTELSSRSQRREFASVIKLLLDKRIAANVHGYEQTPGFKRELAQTYARFVDTLESGSPNFKQEEIDEFARLSISAFERNEEQFESFFEKNIKPDPQLKGMSRLEASRKLLQFSAWLYINDRETWLGIWKITFLWPWCYGR